MSAWVLFVTSCVCAGVLALTCAVIIWAVKNILGWIVDDISDSIDTIVYRRNKRKRQREEEK